MGENLVSSATTVLLAIVSLAIIATLVSKQANTSGVIQAGATGFSGALTAATNPFSGASGSSFNSAGYME
jgi:PRD1 phage membrane DNA delivery